MPEAVCDPQAAKSTPRADSLCLSLLLSPSLTCLHQLMDTLAEIEERHNAVQEIEAQLQELHQMFLDMAVLVDSQGELVHDIENQVSDAKEHVEKGTEQLVVARKTQLNTRKVGG